MSELLKWGAGGLQVRHAEKMDEIQAEGWKATTAGKLQENAQAEADAAISQKAAAMMQQIAVGNISSNPSGDDANTPTSMSKAFQQTGDNLIKLGFVEKGMEYHKNASTLNKDESDANKARLDQQKVEGELLIGQSELVANQLGEAGDDPEMWKQGLDNLERSGRFTPEQMESFRNIPQNTFTADFLRQKAIRAKDKATLSLRAQGLEQERDNIERTQSNRDRLFVLAKAKHNEAIRLQRLADKAGTAATAPSVLDVTYVEGAIKTEIFAGKSPTNADVILAFKAGAQTIAARAKDMVRNDKSLSWDIAVNRAVLESKALGDWGGLTDTSFWGEESVSPIKKYKPKGTSPETALPVPKSAKDAIKGRHYGPITLPDGSKGTGVWTGSGFQP